MQPSPLMQPGIPASPLPRYRYVVGPRWRALRFLAFLFKLLAWLNLLVGVLGIVYSLFFASKRFPALDIVTASIYLGGALLTFLFLYVFADLILLLIAIEKNTRK